MKPQNTSVISMAARVATVVILFLTTLISCDFNKKDPQPQSGGLDPVDPAFIELLSAQKAVDWPLNKFILPNGENVQDFYDKAHSKKSARFTDILAESGPQAKRNTIIAEMIKAGNDMTKDIVFNDVSPAQKGIAYAYGSKDYTLVQSPTDGTCNRNRKFHGIDCSGFIYQMAKAAGLDLGSAKNTKELAKPVNWEKAIQAKGSEYKKIRVEDVSNEVAGDDNKLQTGDILLFYNAKGEVHHIAMALKDESGLTYFLNSYGDPNKNCESHFNKGPTKLSIDKKIWFNKTLTYSVLRIVTDISGKWEAGIRCSGQTYDAVVYKIEFTTSRNDDNVTGSGTGVDYDGVTKVDVQFKGQYMKESNILSGKMVFNFPADPSQNREDSFSIKLNYDDTGYFNATKVVDNGGCYLQLKLVNLEK